MKIDAYLTTDGSNDYYDESFRFVLESHLSYFRTLPSTGLAPVEPNDTKIYDQDFFSYLNDRNIKPCFHWFIMRLNNFFSPNDFNSSVTSVLLPDDTALEKIRQAWNSSKNNVLKT